MFVTLLVQMITVSLPILSLLFVFFIFTKQLKATPSHIQVLSFPQVLCYYYMRLKQETPQRSERSDVYIGKKMMEKGREGKVKLLFFFLLKLERRLKTLLFKGKMSVNTNILNSFSFRSGVNPS